MNDIEKQKIIRDIEESLIDIPKQGGLCLYYAIKTLLVLRSHGYDSMLQAGSMSWPIIRPEDDDGEVCTHFSYQWSPETWQSQFSVAMGGIPEMHIWVAILDTKELVDFSTRFFKESAEDMGFTWRADIPPRYLWCHELPPWVRYEPDEEATGLAYKLFGDIVREQRTKDYDDELHIS